MITDDHCQILVYFKYFISDDADEGDDDGNLCFHVEILHALEELHCKADIVKLYREADLIIVFVIRRPKFYHYFIKNNYDAVMINHTHRAPFECGTAVSW